MFYSRFVAYTDLLRFNYLLIILSKVDASEMSLKWENELLREDVVRFRVGLILST